MQRFNSFSRLLGKFSTSSTHIIAMSIRSYILFLTRFSITMIQQFFSPLSLKSRNYSILANLLIIIVLVSSQTACVDPKDTKVDIVIVDSIGNAKGEIAYVADNNNIYTLNAAGGGSKQLTSTADATQVRFRGDRKQFTYIDTNGVPVVINKDGSMPSFTPSIDFNNPKNYEYKKDILYFFNSGAKIRTSDPVFNDAINSKINLLNNTNDVVKYVTLLPNNDLVIILENSSPNDEIVWYDSNTNTAKRHQPGGRLLAQARFYDNGKNIMIRSTDNILSWKNTENYPKPVFSTSNIRTFAINPTGTEIAYVKNEPNQNIVYVKNIVVDLKLDRILPTMAPENILDIDWK